MKRKLSLFLALLLSVPLVVWAFRQSPYTVRVMPKAEPTPTPTSVPVPKAWQPKTKKKMPATNYLDGLSTFANSGVLDDANLTDNNTGTAGTFYSSGAYVVYDLGAAYVIDYVAADFGGAGNLQFKGSNNSDMSSATNLGAALGGVSGYVGQLSGVGGAFRYVSVESDAGITVNELYAYDSDPFAGGGGGGIKKGGAGIVIKRHRLGK